MALFSRIVKVSAAILMVLGGNSVWGLDEPALNEAHKADIKLFEHIYTLVQSCIVKDSVEVDNCLEMFKGFNLNNPKYQGCKCLVPCIAKHMDMMYTDGTYDFRQIRKVTSTVQSDYFRKEIERVLDICETEPGTDCDGGFNIVNCAIQHSHIASRSLRMMFETLDEHYAQSLKTDGPKGEEAEKISV